MSIDNHRRRIHAWLGRRRSGKGSGKDSGDAFLAAVHEADRRRRQEMAPAMAMVAFAQALAGTVLQPREQGAREASRASHDADPDPSAPPRPGRRARSAPPPGPPPRPDQHTVVTWDEAMRVKWIGLEEQAAPCGALLVERPAAHPPRPKDWIDPWPGGEFLIPSYAGEAEE